MDEVIKRVQPVPSQTHSSAATATPGAVPWTRILIWIIATRILIALMAGFSSLIIPAGGSMGNAQNLWEAFMRWDTGWFMSIVEHGYFFDPARGSNVAFMPLYPALVWIFSLGRLIEPKIVGVIISNAALFYGCISLWRIAMRRWNSTGTADLSVALVLFGPVSFFLSIFYSEALFFCAVAACLDEAERERWAIAGLWGMAAALTRNAGFILVLPLLIYFLFPWKRPRQWRQILWLGLPVLGSAAFTLYLWFAFGDAQLYTKAQRFWGRELTPPWVTLQNGYHNNYIPAFFRIYFRGAAAFAAVMLVLAAFVRARISWVVMMVIWPLLYVSTLLLDSLPPIPDHRRALLPRRRRRRRALARRPLSAAAVVRHDAHAERHPVRQRLLVRVVRAQ